MMDFLGLTSRRELACTGLVGSHKITVAADETAGTTSQTEIWNRSARYFGLDGVAKRPPSSSGQLDNRLTLVPRVRGTGRDRWERGPPVFHPFVRPGRGAHRSGCSSPGGHTPPPYTVSRDDLIPSRGTILFRLRTGRQEASDPRRTVPIEYLAWARVGSLLGMIFSRSPT